MPEQTLTSHPSSIRFTSKPQTATLWTLNLHSFCCLFLSLQKGLPTKHYCLHCAIRRHHHAHLPCRWMSLGACSLGGLLYPGNGGSLRDLTLKPRYWLLPLFLLFVVVVVFFIYLLNMCVCCVCVCVCLGVQLIVGGGGGGVRGWGLRRVCRHQDGAIQVAVAVTGAAVWAVLTRSSLDALDEPVDSWELLAVSRALVFISRRLYLHGTLSADIRQHFCMEQLGFLCWLALKYQRLEIWCI